MYGGGVGGCMYGGGVGEVYVWRWGRRSVCMEVG